MKNFKFFLMLAFAMFVFNVSFGSAVPDDNKDISQVVDVDVGVEAVAVATFEFTSVIFISSDNRREAIRTDNKFNFLESPDTMGIWKFENTPLTNTKTSSKTDTRIFNSTSGGMAGTRGLGQTL